MPKLHTIDQLKNFSVPQKSDNILVFEDSATRSLILMAEIIENFTHCEDLQIINDNYYRAAAEASDPKNTFARDAFNFKPFEGQLKSNVQRFIIALSKLRSLKSITIISLFPFPVKEIIDAFIEVIRNNKNLKSINFVGAYFDSAQLNELINVVLEREHLSTLRLMHCGITDNMSQILTRLFTQDKFRLDTLMLGGNDFTEKMLNTIFEKIKRFPKMTMDFRVGDGSYKPTRTAEYLHLARMITNFLQRQEKVKLQPRSKSYLLWIYNHSKKWPETEPIDVGAASPEELTPLYPRLYRR